MRFMLSFKWRSGPAALEAIARFAKTGGRTPDGAKLIGRWTRADFNGGFDLIETDDPRALTQFAVGWADLCELEVTPVVSDDELVAVLEKMGKL